MTQRPRRAGGWHGMDPDPLTVEPEPVRRPRIPDEPRIWLIHWLLLVPLILIAIAIAWLLLAAPRSGQTTALDPSRDLSAAPGLSAGLSGAPPDSRALPVSGRNRQAGKLGGAPLPVPTRSSLAGEPTPALHS